MVTAWARLALLLFSSALATTRLSLVIHEFVGHGAVAVLQGGTITDYKLFAFGGGRIAYDLPELALSGRLAIALGGIALEILIGLGVLLICRARKKISAWRLALALFGAANLIHGLSYLTFGAHYGYGDGALLHASLSPGPLTLLTIVGALGLVAAGYWASLLCAARAIPLVATRRFRLAIVAAATLSAALVHIGLTFGAAAMAEDQQYARIKQSDAQRRTAIAIARYRAQAQAQRQPPSASEMRAKRRQLEAENAPFPLRLWLLPAVLLAIIAGAWRSSRRPLPAHRPVRSQELAALAGVAAPATLLVVLL